MKITKNQSLAALTTFGIKAQADYFSTFSSKEELAELLESEYFRSPDLLLGGGSNILLLKNLKSVLKNEVRGIEKIKEDEDSVFVKVGAGENWHQFVLTCIKKGWAGIENLSLIPGNVGASPMQNIGAYGVEIKDTFDSLEAFHIKSGEVTTFYNEDCHFGYRDSVFKNEYKDQFVILNVTYRLSKKPQFHTSYGAIQKELEKMGVQELSIKAISDAVIRIRSAKLPDPKDIGSAGSFFKNPIVSGGKYKELTEQFPDVRAYPFGENYKLAAGWLIDQCGWKGYRKGDAGVHKNQALILVNYGTATSEEIHTLSKEIQNSVWERFGVQLEREVNLIG